MVARAISCAVATSPCISIGRPQHCAVGGTSTSTLAVRSTAMRARPIAG